MTTPSGDLEGLVAYLDLDAQRAAECVGVAAQAVDLGEVDLAPLELPNALLADLQRLLARANKLRPEIPLAGLLP